MRPFGVEYFYSKFWSMVMMPEYIALAVTAFITIMLVKTGALALTGYKKFWFALVIAAVANIIIVAGMTAFFLFNIRFTSDLLIFCGVMMGGCLVVDLAVTFLFKGKSSLMDGLIGSLLGNLVVTIAGLIIVILELYPLA
jgi:CDP-diglyceride synthetase